MTVNKENIIAVDADGEIIVWVDGSLGSPNPELIKKVEQASLLKRTIETSTGFIEANLDDPKLWGVLASLLLAKPGRGRILEAPKHIVSKLIGEKHV